MAKKKDMTNSGHTPKAFLKTGKTGSMPSGIKPMLASLVNAPFDDPLWSYEIKWDGYRCIAYISSGNVSLASRNNKSFTDKYYPLTSALQQWKNNAVLDGEILVIKEDGKADFSALQNWRSEADGHLVFYIFDILWYNGINLMELELSDRQLILKQMLPTHDDRIRLSQTFDGGLDFFETASKMGLEGIMAKRKDSLYIPDSRSKQWLKIKAKKRQEVVIAGYTKNDTSSKLFSSLLLGVYQNGTLLYTGKVGTGFTDKMQREMMDQFTPLITKTVPFENEPDINKPSRFRPDPPHAQAVWLKPVLVCEVSYAEITSDGVFRHPSFEGMRSDKKASDVVLEKEESSELLVREKKGAHNNTPSPPLTPPEKSARRTLLNPSEETQTKKIKGHNLTFSHLSKIYWPEDGFTKRDMFNYYYQAAEFILPYLKDRPLSLNRFPGGIHGKSFYQKDVKGKAPEWAKTFPYTTSDGESKEFLVGGDEKTLLYMASLGCIEMNPWFSRIQHPDNPDYCVIDLDPDRNTFEQVIQAAGEVKNVLDALQITGYVKTSGSTGIHIYIPLGAKYSYDQSQMFGKMIVSIVHSQLEDFTSLERQIKNRGGKMYLDFLQNRPGATIACPYSLRPKSGATVSMPLHWEEVKKGLAIKDFTIENSIARMRAEGDIFKGSLQKGINMKKAVAKAQSIFY
ncbi:DNA ligase D [Flavobacterium endoglycinae]|uniref:DNA ligase (ATP) n=1 Tax=Flavobacterium endoglycinae TaxID=2816357 RepID=A0ABX7QBK9_9FLAO|nr:DNA ligase D [Flavobacterium endoglycinae]QSW88430.1 DNA ligase D [Flavobacterium endoglycinae]